VSDALRKAAVEYVQHGGKLLVLDSYFDPDNPDKDTMANKGGSETVAPRAGDTTNDLLAPFGLAVRHSVPLAGQLKGEAGWQSIPVGNAAEVDGGTPFAWIDGKPVAATLAVGKAGGSVTVVGFAIRFNDANMGGSADAVPMVADPSGVLAKVYDWEYRMARQIITGSPGEPMTLPPAKKPDASDTKATAAGSGPGKQERRPAEVSPDGRKLNAEGVMPPDQP
jgi:hypothetical protein